MSTIHLVGWAGQPDLQIECTREWTTPKWGFARPGVPTPKPYLAENGMRYAFDPAEVTCVGCLAKAGL